MRKFLLGLFLLQLISLSAIAQVEHGSVLIGGKVNFHTTNSDDRRSMDSQMATSQTIKSNEFHFNPQIGFVIGNNWVVGPMFTYATEKSVRNSFFSNSSNSERITSDHNVFGAALFARKYLPFGDKFSAFAELNSGVLWNKFNSVYETSSSDANENETKYDEYQTNLMAGLAYFPINWLAIELSTNLVSFTHSKQHEGEGNFKKNSNSLDFGFNTSAINLGVSFFLNNK